MSDSESFGSYWVKQAVREKLAAEIVKSQSQAAPQAPRDGYLGLIPTPSSGLEAITPDKLPPDERFEFEKIPLSKLPKESRICIIGAGVTGLYIAMILDSLAIPGLTYDILEGSGRTGGRLLTHYFTDKKHDYYDIGAMRFPKIKIMERTFDLFEKRLKVPLIKYYLSDGAVHTPNMYNDQTIVKGYTETWDPYRVSKKNGGSVPDDTVTKGVDGILNDAFGKYKDVMAVDFQKGFEMLMGVDEYSTRQYLRDPQHQKLDFYSIQWLETNNTSSNLFDQAFTESVIDSFDFDTPNEKPDDKENWFCIDGGSSLVTKKMESSIEGSVEHYKRVNKITTDENKDLVVSVVNEPKPRKPYTTVFNTTSLGCLQRMDLTGLSLHPSQKDAIRSLHYDDSAKVAIKFSYPWWIKDCGISSGGTGNTDIPLRTCVYPSYNLNDGLDKEAVLLCSYTWSQDATRIGSLINRHSPEGEGELLDLLIENIVRLHAQNFWLTSGGKGTPNELREIIKGAYVTHHAFSWSHDPFTSGAFALFGPGQFRNLAPYLRRPAADSRFHICGEHTSCHHAWVVGSLNSAYMAVHRFLNRFDMFAEIEKMEAEWGTVDELDTGIEGTEHLQVALGQLKDGEHVRV